MLEAITTSKCQESFSLEGLELLGDAFLEVSVSERLFLLHNRLDEGELSKRRTNLICNKMLERLGRERGIMVSKSCRDTTRSTYKQFEIMINLVSEVHQPYIHILVQYKVYLL